MRPVNSRLMLRPVVVGCLLTVSSSACDARRPSMSGAPTAPTAPTAPAVPTVTLSGTVAERFSGQPIQGVQVALFPQTYPSRRPLSWPPPYKSTPSDSAGRYTTTGIPADFGSFFVLPVYSPYGTCAAMSHDGDAVLRCESGRHPDIGPELRRRQLAAAAAHAWHSNHFGHRVRDHRGRSAADRGCVGRIYGRPFGRRHGCRDVFRCDRPLSALRTARRPTGPVCLKRRVFARQLVAGC